MLLLHGSKYEEISTSIEEEITCSYCKSGPLKLIYYQKFRHIFFLPVFPTGKALEIYCYSCGAANEECISKELVLKNPKPKTPVKYWIGTFIILVFAALIYLTIHQEDQETNECLNNPQIGDIYTIYSFLKLNNGQENNVYSFFKIDAITKDSIEMLIGDYFYSYYPDINEILESKVSVFTSHHQLLPKSALVQMKEKDQIKSIYRKKAD
jgi:hypothetical protein